MTSCHCLLSPPYHDAQHDPLAACFRLTKCWIYESLNEYFREGGFTSCCGDLKCFCVAFVHTRWHWIFMISLNLQRAMQTLMNITEFCTSNMPLFTATAGTVLGASGRVSSALNCCRVHIPSQTYKLTFLQHIWTMLPFIWLHVCPPDESFSF